MATRRETLIAATLQNQRDILQAGLTRRQMLKYGLLSGSGYLALKSGLSLRALAAAGDCGPSFDPLAPCVSAPTRPFLLPLRIPSVASAVSEADLSIAPNVPEWASSTPVALRAPEWTKHKGVQLLSARPGTATRATQAKCYRQLLQEAKWQWHPDLGGQDTAWVFDNQFPGPTFLARHREPVLVRRFNCLSEQYVLSNRTIPGGFGNPWPSTHLHNYHTADQSDGGPWEMRRDEGKGFQGIDARELSFGMFGPGDYHDYHYALAWAGFTDPNVDPWGDPNEAMNTLWYHDHCRDFTSQNVYKGMAGNFFIFDDKDTGNETTGLRFPCGDGANGTGYGRYDIPLTLSDRMFNAGGESVFPLFNLDGVLGDKYTVNGIVQPFFNVKPRRYRFRMLAIGPSRVYRLAVVKGNPDGTGLSGPLLHAMCVISNQGNLLPNPVICDRINICPAERFDILVDFGKLKSGLVGNQRLFLVNLMEQTDGRGPTYKDMRIAGSLMRFDVDTDPAATQADQSIDYFLRRNRTTGTVTTGVTGVRSWVNRDYTLCTLPPRPTENQLRQAGVKTNSFRFDRTNGNWSINGRLFNDAPFNGDTSMQPPRNGEQQIWSFKVNGNWTHPIHVHFEEGQVLSYNGAPIASIESRGPFDDKGRLLSGRRDVYCLGPNDEMRVLLRFRDFNGRYPMHCHNVVHEDHAMMMSFDIMN